MKPWDWYFLLVVFVLEPMHRLFERSKGKMTTDDTCPECGGLGLRSSEFVYVRRPSTFAHEATVCYNCDGTGHVPRCAECGAFLQHVRPGKWQCNNEHKREEQGR